MSRIRSLKITTLADNLVQKANFQGQWGLSFLLELDDARGDARKMVFDTGNDRAPLMFNISKLKLDLGDLDCIVLSHGHGDHTVATAEIVKKTGGVKVYSHPHVFQPRFTVDKEGSRRRGGVPRGEGVHDIERAGGEVILSAEPYEVVPGVWTTGQIPRVTPFEKVSPPFDGGKRLIIIDDKEVDDQILDDQALFTNVEEFGPFVLTGCAHSGPINTLLRAKTLGAFGEIHGFVGGTHLVQRSDDYVEKTLQALRRFGLRLLSPCHCTGFKATSRIWQSFSDEFVLNYCGRIIEAGKEPEPKLV